ncbi:MAG: hypothetical protein K2X27_04835 [Candidatus Obscuribacterales bacterium]|nr:hypothetical protein [Candidatus Obscuribacterales bacterium]
MNLLLCILSLLLIAALMTLDAKPAFAKSAERRIADFFQVSEKEISESSIQKAVLKKIPLNSPFNLVIAEMRKMGLYADPLSQIVARENSKSIICLFQYDPNDFALSKASYQISFEFSDAGFLRSVGVVRYFTGL